MDGFVSDNNKSVIDFAQMSKNKNTTRSTNTWVCAFKEWANVRNEDGCLENYSCTLLDAVLSRFFY